MITACFGVTCWNLQPFFMGFYQLARLYYCFANNQIHSDKGYPKKMYVIMYIFGIILAINAVVCFVMTTNSDYGHINWKCGINENFEFYSYPIQLMPRIGSPWLLISFILFVLWDLFTLILYLWKINLFLSSVDRDPNVYKRIMLILHKITILTLLYQITAVLLVGINTVIFIVNNDEHNFWVRFSARSSVAIVPFCLNYSMYLMMDHNERKYFKFLRVIHWMKLHWICCKWRYIVAEQLHGFDDDSETTTQRRTTNTKSSKMDTTDLSHHVGIKISEIDMQISAETTTINEDDTSAHLQGQ